MTKLRTARTEIEKSILTEGLKGKALLSRELEYKALMFAEDKLMDDEGNAHVPKFYQIKKWLDIALFFIDFIKQLIGIWNGEITVVGFYKRSEK